MAAQLKDAPLFEKARRLSWTNLNAAACHDIAEVYLEAGDATTAHDWLKRVEKGDTFCLHERQQLAMRIHEQLGNRDEMAAVAWDMFRSNRSASSLDALLAATGSEQRVRVIAESADEIVRGPNLDLTGLAFLIEVEQIEAAEAHVLKHAASRNGDFYDWLLPVAEAFVDSGRALAASLVCRSLLNSILRRGQPKTYNHGVKYLRKLDKLAPGIGEWRGFLSHTEYKLSLRAAHGRKRSFWGKYERDRR